MDRVPAKVILMTSVAAFAAAVSGAAFAQATDVGEVVVTASRAGATGYAASTPTVVIGADTFEKKGLANVADVVMQNPAFKADASPGGNGVKSAAPGQTSANLRSLGGARTLVLVNGARIVPLAPATSTGTPVTTDLNTIPAILISRAEVVTGGASAQWGSDAISGVVNIILNNKYEGLKITGQYGISDHQDAAKKSVAALGGTSFAGGRGHIVVAGEFQNFEGMGDYRARDYSRRIQGVYTTTAAYRTATGNPDTLLRAPNFVSAYAQGGNIVQTAPVGLRNIAFLPNGGTTTWNPGAFQATQVQFGGGEGLASWIGINLQPSFERYSTYGRVQYDVTDNVTASLEVGYSHLKGKQTGSTPRIVLGSTPYTDPNTLANTVSKAIQIDNAYLPASVKAAMTAAGVTNFQLARMSTDIGPARNTVETKTPHFAVGLEGKLTDTWKWDAHYTWGQNKYLQTLRGNLVTARYNYAADAVVNPANGQIVCRATLAGASFNAAAAGCVPMNLFGNGSVSDAARNYVTATSIAKSDYKQQTASFNVQGELFNLPAGPIAIGTGVEWRHESQDVDADDLASKAQFLAVGNAGDFAGKFSTKEAYIDSIIPIVKDVPFFKAVDITAAGRISDYTSVGTAKTWKLGLNWQVVNGLKFRVTKSKDFRAPAVYELYGIGQVITTTVSLKGVSYVIPQNFTAGNPDVGPEKGKTFTAGVVFEPTFVPGLRASVDYFKITIDDAISAPNNTTVANQCTNGSAFFCSFFTFNAAGQPTSLLVGAQNLASLEVEGIDFALNYTKDLSSWPGMPERARLDLGVQGTYTDHFINDTGVPGAPAQDLAGQNTDGGSPRWRVQFQQSLTLNKLRFTAEEFFVSKGILNNQYNNPLTTLRINDNTVPKYWLMNIYANYDVTEKLRAFVAVDNVFDKDPPSIPSQDFPTPDVAGATYDKTGRNYRIGLTYEF
jgi:outer membrane receptor protein involved in Fe transport